MKRIIFLFVLLFSVAGANAQVAEVAVNPNQERAHAYALSMQKQLGLTAEQTTQIEAIFLAKITAIEVVNADAAKTQEQKDAEIVQIRSEKEKELQSLLTPDQLIKYNQIRADRKARKEAAGQTGE